MPDPVLEFKHVWEVLLQDITIGADSKTKKRFCFNPWLNEYRIYVGDKCISSGQVIEELLEEYNNI